MSAPLATPTGNRIEDYALIGDLHTGALVGRDGSIDWLCLPNFDSPACFAALLDSPDAGRWLLAPAAGGARATRRYHGDTLVLETEWQTGTGRVRVIDFMPPRSADIDMVRIVVGEQRHRADAHRARAALRLRPGGAVGTPARHRRAGGGRRPGRGVAADAGAAARATARPRSPSFTVAAGERVPFVLTWRPS